MDPTAYDRWWRNIIEKEEAEYVNHLLQRGRGPTVKLTALGTPAVYQSLGRLSSANNHLRGSIVGSGMQVRKAQPEGGAGSIAAYPPARRAASCSGRSNASYRGVDDDARSVASSAAVSARGAMTPRSNVSGYATPRSNAGGYATPRSACSYPKTPTFSAADSEVMDRLDRLEKQLMEERLRREMAERDIRELMRSSGQLTTPPGRGGGGPRR